MDRGTDNAACVTVSHNGYTLKESFHLMSILYLAWSVLISTTIFVITVVKMLLQTYSAVHRESTTF